MKKKYAVITISFLTVAAVSLGIFAAGQHRRAETYKLYMENNFQHAFDELVTAVGEMDTALQKSLYATSPGMVSAVCTEVFGKAMTAQMSLGVLPFSSQEMEEISGFISRVGDYAFALSRAAASGETYSEEQTENLKSLSDTASLLAQNMKGLQTDMFDGVLSMDELYKSESTLDSMEETEVEQTVGGSMRLIESEFPEVPALIYDGPFSQHLADHSPAMLEGMEEIDENTGRDIAAKFLRIERTRVYPAGECEGEIPCIYYSAQQTDGETVSVAISRKGGAVLGMLSSRQAGEVRVSIEDALEAASEFLSTRGISGMRETYHMLQGSVLTVNYAFEQGEVLCYPDLIKVSVAMDTGVVCAFEATGYVSSHHLRSLPEVAVSAEKASERVAAGLSIENTRLALIPTAGGEERLCHEFLCKDEEERHFLIYVNAENGVQEKILILLEDENGSLTI